MEPSDWCAVREIYQLGIESGLATLELSAPGWTEWDALHLQSHRWVAVDGGEIVGWAALAFSHRTVAEGVAESSVYVHPSRRRQQVGSRLLGRLIDASERAGYWTLEARILEENVASLRLHEQHGFRLVGVRERIGRLKGEWRNVLLLERRSQSVGA
jgi:L-amino acid N-acyltransferase YncA